MTLWTAIEMGWIVEWSGFEDVEQREDLLKNELGEMKPFRDQMVQDGDNPIIVVPT